MEQLRALSEHGGAVAVVVAVGFLAGSIPFGLLLALAFGKTDVRKAGSGNIGATNVARVAGKKLGVITLVLDALKGAIPVWVAVDVDAFAAVDDRARALLGALVGLAALLGHCFTPWLRFKGGKGVATGLGMLIALHPEVAGYAVLAFAVAFLASRLVSVSSLAAAVVVVAALVVRGPVDAALVPVVVALAVIAVRHVENIRRVVKKQELKL
jgi:glycerol-3-phosphate acyltransferase PlsY